MSQPKARIFASCRQRINLAVLLTFAAQVLVPVGYMPSSIASGPYVQLCPTGLGPDVMALLHPQHAANSTADTTYSVTGSHESMEHHRDSSHGQPTESHAVWSAQCPYGAFANSDLAPQTLRSYSPFVQAHTTLYTAEIPLTPVWRVWPALQARAPPLLIAV